MEKNISITATQNSVSTIIEIVMNLFSIISRPIALLSLYYSHCLDREITIKQTWILLNAQVAFVMAAFPVSCPWMMRMVCIAWLLHALKLCKINL